LVLGCLGDAPGQPRGSPEVITLLKSSDFVAHDLCHAFDHCDTQRPRRKRF